MAQVSLTPTRIKPGTQTEGYEKQWLALYVDFIPPGSTLLKGMGEKNRK